MSVSAEQVKELRAQTGAGIMDCKRALAEVDGNFDQAMEFLRKKGLAAAAKKASRIASEGVVSSYIHGGKIGVLVEINCETDFVARNEDFQAFVKDIGMHIAAANPAYVSRDDVPEDIVAKERKFLAEQASEDTSKPEAVIAKMVEGRINKFFKECCLLEQPFIKDPDHSVEAIVNQLVAKIGEKINVRRFTRFALGEGLEKRSEDFAAEVAKASQAN